MSSSRPGGSGLTCWARSISSSVVSPIAETTTTTSLPALRVSTIRSATRLMRSASATRRAAVLLHDQAHGLFGKGVVGCTRTSAELARSIPRWTGRRTATTTAPRRRPAAVVLQPVQQVGHHVGDVVGEPAGERALARRVGVEDRGILVDRLEQVGQPGADRVDVGVGAGVGLEPLIGHDVGDRAEPSRRPAAPGTPRAAAARWRSRGPRRRRSPGPRPRSSRPGRRSRRVKSAQVVLRVSVSLMCLR